MSIEFESKNEYLTVIMRDFDPFCSISIRKHETLGVLLECEDFYGEFNINELETIIAKMKELQSEVKK